MELSSLSVCSDSESPAQVETPFKSLIKKTPYSWILWKHFLNGGSLLSGNNSNLGVQLTQDKPAQPYHVTLIGLEFVFYTQAGLRMWQSDPPAAVPEYTSHCAPAFHLIFQGSLMLAPPVSEPRGPSLSQDPLSKPPPSCLVPGAKA